MFYFLELKCLLAAELVARSKIGSIVTAYSYSKVHSSYSKEDFAV